MARSIYNNRVWRTVRAEVLERDHYLCQIRGRRCRRVATEADHIIPVADGGALYDPANLRAACKPCNIARANSQKHREGWRRANARIVLVIGPPGSGKTTYVGEHAGSADVVVDYDAISEALGPQHDHAASRGRHAVVMAARNAILQQIRRGEVDARTIYIISANPKAETIFPYHEVVDCDPGREETLRRCAESRPASYVTLVEDWYRRRGGASSTREW